MKRQALLCLIVTCIACGCGPSKETYIQKHEMIIGYVAGPFFFYSQTKLAETRHFNLGDIPNDVRRITATIPFTNQGHGILIIEKVDCDCLCFAGWDGDKETDFYKGGMINIYFDKDKLSTGPVSIPVLIKTNDPSNSEVKIFFDFNVVRSRE
jgi:Protein of unknown function (DUF1573)